MQTEFRLLKSHIRAYWWFWILVIGSLFSFPLREGIKIDPAFYGTLAKNILDRGSWWPLSFAPGFFEEFLAHPPGVIWAMVPFVAMGPESNWCVHLFSRLCTLFLYVALLVSTFRIVAWRYRTEKPKQKLSEGVLLFSGTLAVFLLHSWIQWIKYAGAGQLEGPLALSILLTVSGFVFLETTTTKTSVVSFPFLGSVFFVAGFLGLLFKAMAFAPVIAAVWLWFAIKRNKEMFWGAVLLSLGFFAGIGLLYLFDVLYETTWFHSYFVDQLFYLFVKGYGHAPPMAPNPSRIFTAIFATIQMEMRYAFIWSLPLWICTVWALVKTKRLHKNVGLLSSLVYLAYMGAVCISAHKLPHWTVPIYPVGVLIFVCVLPRTFFTKPEPFFSNSLIPRAIALGAVLYFAIAPYPTLSRYGRGEGWAYHAKTIHQLTSQENPLRVITVDGEDPWFDKVYSAYFLGGYSPKAFGNVEVHTEEKCVGGALILQRKFLEGREEKIRKAGWRPTPHQYGRHVLFECGA